MKSNRDLANSWRSCLYIYYLSYPLFATVFIEWLRFFSLITLQVKTSSKNIHERLARTKKLKVAVRRASTAMQCQF